MSDNQDIVQTKAVENEQSDIPEEVGSVKIADEVISIVAGLAATEVPGVAGMSGGLAGGIAELLGKKNFSKGVKVIVTGKTVTIEIYVIIEYDICIPDVAIVIQEKVKEAVESMTGFEVAAVDIHVQGIARRKVNEIEE
ncbi:MAG: Asp23/Gls24 family envelope stress response protein [Acidaminococcaceae bacterium]